MGHPAVILLGIALLINCFVPTGWGIAAIVIAGIAGVVVIIREYLDGRRDANSDH